MILKTETAAILLCDDINLLSAARYHRFCAKYLDYSVGADVFTATGHIGRMLGCINRRDYIGLREEFSAFAYDLNRISDEAGGVGLVVACLVDSINGKACIDITDTGLSATAQLLLDAGLTQEGLSELVVDVKSRWADAAPLEIKGNSFTLQDDVRTLTVARYQRFCAKYLEYSVGSDLQEVHTHLGRMAMFFNAKDYEGMRGEFNNLVLNLNNIRGEVCGPAIVLAALVTHVDGEPCNDLSDSGLAKTAARLLATGASQPHLASVADKARTRVDAALMQLFPILFPQDTHLFEMNLLQKLLLECDMLLGSTSAAAQVAEVESVLLQQLHPANLHPSDNNNAFLSAEASFENACILLEGKGVSDPAELSLYAFYSRVQFWSDKKNSTR